MAWPTIRPDWSAIFDLAERSQAKTDYTVSPRHEVADVEDVGTGAALPGGGGATDLESLSDVDLTSPAPRQGLYYDGASGAFLNAYDPGHNQPPVTKTSDFAVSEDDYTFFCDCSSGNIVGTLPSAVGLSGKTYGFRKTDSTANTVTIQTVSSQTINAATTTTVVRQYQQRNLVSDGTRWLVNAGARGGTTPDTGDGDPSMHDPPQTISADGAINMDVDLVLVNTTSSNVTASLGTASGREGKEITVKNVGTGSNLATLDAFGSETIDGQPNLGTRVSGDAVTVRAHSSGWVVTSPPTSYYG